MDGPPKHNRVRPDVAAARGAGLKPAVSPSCTRQGVGKSRPPTLAAPAGCKPAIQRSSTPRYLIDRSRYPSVIRSVPIPIRPQQARRGPSLGSPNHSAPSSTCRTIPSWKNANE